VGHHEDWTLRPSGRRVAVLASTLVILAFTTGCGGGDKSTSSKPPQNEQDLVPLVAGNRWVYAIEGYYSSRHPSGSYVDTLSVGAQQPWRGSWGYVVHSSLRAADMTAWKLDKDGLWEWTGRELWSMGCPEQEDALSSAWHLQTPYPADSDSLYVVTIQDHIDYPGGYSDPWVRDFIRVSRVDTVVVVPAGTFHCIAYEHEVLTERSEAGYECRTRDWYAPGVGLIMRVGFEYGGNGTVASTIRLAKFLPTN